MTKFFGRIFSCILLVLFVSGTAVARSEVTDAIPSSASWVIVAHHIGKQSATVRTILDRFKGLVPELGNEKIASELRRTTGEDLASAEGMIAYGIDPEGSAALWADDFEKEPYVVIPISDQKKFIERLSRKIKVEDDKAGLARPKIRAGVSIYTKNGERFGIKNGYLVLEPSAGGKIGIKSFFSRGKKLGKDVNFLAVKKEIPNDRDGLMYFSVSYMRKAWKKHQKDFQEHTRKLLKTTKSPATKKMFSEELSGAVKTQRRFDRFLQGFRGVGFWWKLKSDRLTGGALFATTPKGQRTLAKVFPTQVSVPGFHKRMLKASMLGGWSSVNPGAFLDWIGDAPQAPWITMKDELLRSAKEFRKEVKMDLFSDFINNLSQPVGAYILVPSIDMLDTKAPVDNQFLSLMRVALVAKVNDSNKAKALLSRFDVMADKNGATLKHPKAQGVTITTLTEQGSGMEISWAQNKANIMMGIGSQPFSVLFRAVSDEAGRSSDLIGETRIDFPAISEVISSAVSKGFGGSEGVRMRMMWPIVKQLFGRFGALDIRGFFTKNGLKFVAGLDIH